MKGGECVSRRPAKKSMETARYFSSGNGGVQLCAISEMGAREYLDLSKGYIELFSVTSQLELRDGSSSRLH